MGAVRVLSGVVGLTTAGVGDTLRVEVKSVERRTRNVCAAGFALAAVLTAQSVRPAGRGAAGQPGQYQLVGAAWEQSVVAGSKRVASVHRGVLKIDTASGQTWILYDRVVGEGKAARGRMTWMEIP